jgi:hypothetical protein
MAIALQLEWAYCPDGVEIYERVLVGTTIAERAGEGLYLRPRSKRRAARHLYAVDAANAVVLKFASAMSDQTLLEFCKEYGLPGDEGVAEISLEEVRGFRDRLRDQLALSPTELSSHVFSGPRVRLGLAVHRKSRALALRPETLGAYMAAEVAIILAGAASIAACGNCGGLFAAKTGRAAGGKRTDARYCSPRCRVAAHRRKRI